MKQKTYGEVLMQRLREDCRNADLIPKCAVGIAFLFAVMIFLSIGVAFVAVTAPIAAAGDYRRYLRSMYLDTAQFHAEVGLVVVVLCVLAVVGLWL